MSGHRLAPKAPGEAPGPAASDLQTSFGFKEAQAGSGT